MVHHVVALELAVDENVEADLLLPAHGAGRFFAQERLVLGIAQLAFVMCKLPKSLIPNPESLIPNVRKV